MFLLDFYVILCDDVCVVVGGVLWVYMQNLMKNEPKDAPRCCYNCRILGNCVIFYVILMHDVRWV